jgi:hypothetical protein
VAGGLFTSLYDNKIIVLIIIIVIIIIGIGAYIIYRPVSEPPNTEKCPQNRKSTEAPPPPPSTKSNESQTEPEPQNEKNNRTDLLKLLEKTKQNTTEHKEIPAPNNKTTKSDNEIMQLMETVIDEKVDTVGDEMHMSRDDKKKAPDGAPSSDVNI